MTVRATRGIIVGLCLFLVGRASAGDGGLEASIVRGPRVEAPRTDGVTITWETAEPGTGRVIARGADGIEHEAVSLDIANVHRVRFEGLESGARYSYEIASGEDRLRGDPPWTFRVAPDREGSFTAFVLGDSGTPTLAQAQVSAMLAQREADLVLHTGDAFYIEDLDAALFRPFRQTLARSAFVVARGNHDIDIVGSASGWRELFELPGDDPDRRRVFFSFEYGPAHIVVLDWYQAIQDDAEQVAFLRADLASAAAAEASWRIVVLHLPIITAGVYSSVRHPFRTRLQTIADEFRVDLVFSGHDHNYQRSYPTRARAVQDAWHEPGYVRPRGTTYVVTGGGAQRLYSQSQLAADRDYLAVFLREHHAIQLSVSPSVLILEVLGVDGETIDRAEFSRAGERPRLEGVPGDVNRDGVVNLTDAIETLEHLFLGTTLPRCLPAGVVSAMDAPLNVTEPIFLLRYLFRGGPPPPAPFPACGELNDRIGSWCFETGC